MRVRPGTRERDRGLILPITLVVAVVLSLVVVAIVRYGTANLRYAQVTERRSDQLAAADAAMGYAVNLIKIGRADCIFNSAAAVPLPALNEDFNGATGSVTCDTITGGLNSAQIFAVAITGEGVAAGEYLISTQGGSNPKKLKGPLFMERATPVGDVFSLANNAGIEIEGAPLVHASAGNPCTAVDEATLTDIEFTPDIFGPVCTEQSWDQYGASGDVFDEPSIRGDFTPVADDPATVPSPDSGSMPVRDGSVAIGAATTWPAPLPLTNGDTELVTVEGGYNVVGSCRVFHPGRYVRPPDFATTDAYFMSGDYVFDFRDPTDATPTSFQNLLAATDADDAGIVLKQTTVLAGALDPTGPIPAQTLTPHADCNAAIAADVAANRYGATFYMSGLAHIDIETQGGMEFSPRNVGTVADPEYVAIHALCDRALTTWCTNSPTNDAAVMLDHSRLTAPATAASPGVLYTQSGVNRQMVVNGLIYAPLAEMELDNVTGSAEMRFKGGMVVARATLQASTSAENFEIGVTLQDIEFEFRLTATGTDTTGQSTRITSVIDYEYLVPYTASTAIRSWRVCDIEGC
jgi:hypothetical protein